jgi:small subunit ribosomal protein S18
MAPERRKYARKYKIMPRRLTGTCKKHQEMVELSIKRARHTALIPYIIDRRSVVAHPFDQLQG